MNERLAQAIRSLTLLAMLAIKLGGLYIAIRTAVTEPQPSVVQIGEACFMMTGAQVTEDVVLRALSRVFGSSPSSPPSDKPEGRS